MTIYVEVTENQKIVVRGRRLTVHDGQPVLTPMIVLMEIPFQEDWIDKFDLFIDIEGA